MPIQQTATFVRVYRKPAIFIIFWLAACWNTKPYSLASSVRCSILERSPSLAISAKTVGTHVEHIYARIGASNRAQASLFAMKLGLMTGASLEMLSRVACCKNRVNA
jgi:hypothetical protein